MIIVPAILTDDKRRLAKMLRVCESFTDYVQVDIMDGVFVPSRSINADDLREIATNLRIEAHLMVEHPEWYIEDFKRAGVFKVIFHFEATNRPEMVIEAIRASNLEVGLAINPETQIHHVEGLLDKVNSILFLSVNPGFYGARFIPEVLDKVKSLRLAYPQYKIDMDGGIKADNLLKVKEAGVDMVCVGSAILKAKDPKAAFLELKKMAE